MLKDYEIRARRAVEKKTQAEFAEMLGISRQHLIDIESGKVKINKELERRYNILYGGKRLITTEWYTPPPCPTCGRDVPEGKEPVRKHQGATRADDVYQCPICGLYFDTHDWVKAQADKERGK